MIPPAHILLPVDFSERSLDAARQAEVLARHFHSAVTVLHVVAPQENESGRFEAGGVKARELEKVLAQDFTGASISRITRDGDPAEEIVRLANSNPVDLIMMGSHGYRPFESFALGSVAVEVLKSSKCPVWISVQAEQGLAPMFRRVLCSVDLGPGTEGVVTWASQFTAAFDADFFVLHVFPSLESDEPPDCLDAWLSHTERDELDKIKRKLAKKDHLIFTGGDIPEVVCRYARKLQADLLVVGRSPKADEVGITRATGYTIIRKAPCPVVNI
jgi:nucleotide-binding universal stress UspA family protein